MRPPHQLYCVFRLDDYKAGCLSDPTTASLIELIERHGVPHTFGVIPHHHADERALDQDPQAVGRLKQLVQDGLVEAALHGWRHRPRELNEAQRGARPHALSEFVGLPAGVQRQQIADGKQYLEETLDQPLNTFIPPFNSYDEATVQAAADCGLRVLSASPTEPAADPRVTMVPQTVKLRRCRSALHTWHRVAGSLDGPVLLVIAYHAYELDASGTSLADLEMLFEDIRKCDWLEWLNIGQAAERFAAQLTQRRYASCHRYTLATRRNGQATADRLSLFDAPPAYYYYSESFYERWLERLDYRRGHWPRWLLSMDGLRLTGRAVRKRFAC